MDENIKKKTAPKKGLIISGIITALVLILSIVSIIVVSSVKGKTERLTFDGRVDFTAAEGTDRYFVKDSGTLIFSNDGEEQTIYKFEREVLAVNLSKEYLAVATADRVVHLFDRETHERTAASEPLLQNPSEIEIHGDNIYCLTNINGRSSVILFDRNLSQKGVVKEDDAIIRSMGICDGQLTYITEYGEIKVYDGSLQNPISENSLGIFPSGAVVNGKAVYSFDSSGRVYATDKEGVNLWTKNIGKGVYKIYKYGDGCAYIAQSDRSVGGLSGSGERLFDITGIRAENVFSDGESVYIMNGSMNVTVKQGSSVGSENALNGLLIASYVILAVSAVVTALIFVSMFVPKLGRKLKEFFVSVGKKLWASRNCYLVLLPILVLLAMFCYYPAVNALKLAFYGYSPNAPNVFVGVDNFKGIFASEYIYPGVLNLLKFLGTDLLKAVIPTMLFAEVIVSIKSKKFQYATRVLLYLPGILPGVASILIWKSGIFGMDGVVNELFRSLGLDGLVTNWLGNKSTAIWSLVFVGFPWVGSYIILYGALIGIPKEFYEAARLDGCIWIKQVFYIDIPQIFPQLKYVLIMSFIGSLQDFQRVYLTTGGSANTQTPMLGLYTYLNNQELGYAAAMGLLMFVFLFAATIMTFKVDNEEA